ncbi:Photosystem I reaction center subunit VI, chloroplastic [Apostasia shenzhenica]|uniref:Photosystem I reaction center subunit VI n=1 Tax=Apostasia shenzhenica TaxID=1088818 RepID=A0A2I0B0B2_9ASPA|nr:Photosystem I reaction center subunit VI, chloroplastic [Apostasia shenzhenica]
MATLTFAVAAAASVQPITVKSFGSGSSLAGIKLPVRSTRQKPTFRSSGKVVAKYGEKSVYFDLEDLPNTTGQWDLYGSDAPSPYNLLQSKFFETFVAPFTKRGLLLKFSILGGASLLAYLSATATGDILPIKKGPQEKPELGPRLPKIRSPARKREQRGRMDSPLGFAQNDSNQLEAKRGGGERDEVLRGESLLDRLGGGVAGWAYLPAIRWRWNS